MPAQQVAKSLKAMARSGWPGDRDANYPHLWYQPETDRERSALQLRFALDQGVAVAIPPGDADLFFHAVEVARHYQPLSEEELNVLRRHAESVQPLFQEA